MSNPDLLLCTDMDRTIIPNGFQSEASKARFYFSKFCQSENVTLAYVTGRDRRLVEKAIKSYHLPTPQFAITDVGTKIYRIQDGHWLAMEEWEMEIAVDWQHLSHQEIKTIVGRHQLLRLQEPRKQNTHKLSYYLPLHADKEKILAEVEQRLVDADINASLVWSIDEPNDIGLLDILPKNATKLHAIKFLQSYLDFEHADLVFAGDSGNDLPVLESDIQSILVANASDDVKQIAIDVAEQRGLGHALYLASGAKLDMNGNYAAGVLEGVCHFKPAFEAMIGETLNE